MTDFQFRFARVLNYRNHRREVVRRLFAQVLAQRDALLARRSEVESNRRRQLAQMRDRFGRGTVDVDGTASRRFHAGQLTADIAGLERQIQLTDQQLHSCRDALSAAERDAQVLERLEEKQRQEFQAGINRRNQLELEDAWQSARPQTTANE
ncbi:MAG: flagellar FliJ family protein [Planctomycetaceae bacterium]